MRVWKCGVCCLSTCPHAHVAMKHEVNSAVCGGSVERCGSVGMRVERCGRFSANNCSHEVDEQRRLQGGVCRGVEGRGSVRVWKCGVCCLSMFPHAHAAIK